MNGKKIFKIAVLSIGVLILIAGGVGYYMFNQPHRDIQAAQTDFTLTSRQIVNEYLADAKKANAKYLDEEGESKILEVKGVVSKISENFNKLKVVLLKSGLDSAGVSCTFTPETNAAVNQIKSGETVIVKGVIRSGASYDKDLGMYENVIMDKCKLISTKQ
jgi:tRNA_anti-like